jgi:alkylhydroperoxidase family enzyme
MSEPRIAPAAPPYPESVQTWLDRMMPSGVPPLSLFTTLARDPRLFGKFMSAGLLDRGNLTLRQRELVIDRVTAKCGSAYEWGVHVTFWSDRAKLTPEEITSLAVGGPEDRCWIGEERTLLRLCDALHADCDVGDALWAELAAGFSEEARIEILMLAGFYRTVSYLTNALRLAPEPFAAPLPRSR